MNKTPYQSDGWDYEIEVVNEFLTTEQRCYCGDIYTLGVIHRDDGPCHYPNHKEPEQQPTWTIDSLEQEIYENTREFVSLNVMEWLLNRLNTTPPQRTWVGLTDDEFKFIASKYLLSREAGLEYFQEEIESKLREKNT